MFTKQNTPCVLLLLWNGSQRKKQANWTNQEAAGYDVRLHEGWEAVEKHFQVNSLFRILEIQLRTYSTHLRICPTKINTCVSYWSTYGKWKSPSLKRSQTSGSSSISSNPNYSVCRIPDESEEKLNGLHPSKRNGGRSRVRDFDIEGEKYAREYKVLQEDDKK